MYPKPEQIILIDEKHISKYRGDHDNIWVRSSWEKKCLRHLLSHTAVLWVNMEEVIIWYTSPKDNKRHRYFMDFTFEYRTKKGNIRKTLVEVKPLYQTMPPEMTYTKTGRKRQKRYDKELLTYEINIAKWMAAKEFADMNGLKFKILTENPNTHDYVREFKLWDYDEVYKWYKEFQNRS